MTRINLVLLATVLVSAFYLVYTQYESRRLYTVLDRAQTLARKIEVQHEQLRVQKRAAAAPGRIEQLATQELLMHPVSPAITQYVSAPETHTTPGPERPNLQP